MSKQRNITGFSFGAGINHPKINTFKQINQYPEPKFFIFRNPLKRLLSAWHDKMVLAWRTERDVCGHCGVSYPAGSFFQLLNLCLLFFFNLKKTEFGPYIVNEMRTNATWKEIANGCPTFDEYIRYVTQVKNYDGAKILKFAKSYRSTCNSNSTTTPTIRVLEKSTKTNRPVCDCPIFYDPRSARHWFVCFSSTFDYFNSLMKIGNQ